MKVVVFDLTRNELAKLEAYLRQQHATGLHLGEQASLSAYEGMILHSGKRRYTGVLPPGFPDGEPEWVTELISRVQ